MFKNSNKHKPQISIIVALLFLGYLVFYFFQHQSDFGRLLDINFMNLVLICLLQVFMLFINGVFIQKVLLPFQVVLKSRESFKLSVMSSFGNYFTPFQGGMGVRAVYLKSKHNFPYSKFLSTLYGNYLVVFSFQSLVGLLSLFFLHLYYGTFFLFSSLVFLTIFVGTLFLMFFPTKNAEVLSGKLKGFLQIILKKIVKVLEGWKFIRKHRLLLFWLVGLTFLNASAALLIAHTALKSLGIHLGIFQLSLYVTISSLSLLISLTPGSIGIREALLILFQEVIGLSQTEVLQSSVIIRSSMFFVLLILGGLLSLKNAKTWIRGEESEEAGN